MSASRAFAIAGLAALLDSPAQAGEADVVSARAQCRPAGPEASLCRFAVGVKHADEGWDHYADRFEILAPDGRVLGTRVLRHPHVDEQPFVRILDGLRVPRETGEVDVRARDSRHGFGGATLRLRVPHAATAGSEPAAREPGPESLDPTR